VDVPVDTATLARDMHMAGFEVASVETRIDFEIGEQTGLPQPRWALREIATGRPTREPGGRSLGAPARRRSAR
jgi:hypothetical protein